MTIEPIRALYRARPFRPFVIRLADGRAVSVASDEYMTIAPSGRSMIVCQPDDSHVFIDVAQVSSVEVGPVPEA